MIDTRNFSRDYTRVTNDVLRYAARLTGDARSAYFLVILLMHEFGKFGKEVFAAQETLASIMDVNGSEELAEIAGQLEEAGVIKIRQQEKEGRVRIRYLVDHDALSEKLTELKTAELEE